MSKPTYLITNMDLIPQSDENGDNVEYKSERGALAAAKEKLSNSCESEVWVWKLSHIVSEPEIEPDIEVVA